jgi:hypothetical protein
MDYREKFAVEPRAKMRLAKIDGHHHGAGA